MVYTLEGSSQKSEREDGEGRKRVIRAEKRRTLLFPMHSKQVQTICVAKRVKVVVPQTVALVIYASKCLIRD